MSGNTLSPVFSAELAQDVYLIKDEFSRRGFNLKYKKIFNIEQDSMVEGKTGGFLIVKKNHVMAFMAVGQDSYKGQAFVAVKGTASLYDLLTDLNTGIHSSHTGFQVHQGFYYAFDSIVAELRQFVSQIKGVNVIHCVGHSLGGAVATLAADWLKSNCSVPTINLYTFGSPRVGLELFANKCTSKLNSKNIYRVCHTSDPVPMVPTWPFYHVPNNDIGYVIETPVPVVPWKYHLMKEYLPSVKSAGSWEKVAGNRPTGHMEAAIERWLMSDTVQSFNANTLALLDSALVYVIKKVISTASNVAGIAIVVTAGTGLTLLDRLAMLLAKAAKFTKDLGIWVFHLVRKMAAFIGIKVKEGAELTIDFIRLVFIHLHQKISAMIWRIGQELEKY